MERSLFILVALRRLGQAMRACLEQKRLALAFWGLRLGRALHQLGQAAWQQLNTIYSEPFHIITPDKLRTLSLGEVEQQRRIALLRSVVVSFAGIALVIFFMLFFFPQENVLVHIANLLGLLLCAICLAISYSRWAGLSGPVFLLCGDIWILFFSSIDRSGLSIRSVLVTSSVTLLILGAGLLLPRRLVWPTITLMLLFALMTVAHMPIIRPMPTILYNPHLTAVVYLLLLYCLTAIVTALYVRSTRAALETLANAYAQEHALQQQKDEFLHVASHELRAPLGPLILSSQLLERRLRRPEMTTEETNRICQDIIKHAKRMNDMVDLLLDITRIDQQHLTVYRQRCDLAAVIRDAVETQQAITRRAVTLAGLEAPVMGEVDARRLWQVIANLVGNAAKYTPSDAEIRVALQPAMNVETLPGVRIVVEDTGPGIDAEAVPHLFDRYYRAAGESRLRIEGWGLGLYLCQAIVEGHGGTIGVTSIRGQGSIFTIWLPLAASTRHLPAAAIVGKGEV